MFNNKLNFKVKIILMLYYAHNDFYFEVQVEIPCLLIQLFLEMMLSDKFTRTVLNFFFTEFCF